MRGILEKLAPEGLTRERLTRLAVRSGEAEEALGAAAVAALAAHAIKASDCLWQWDWRGIAGNPAAIRKRALGEALLHSAAAEPLRLERLERLSDDIDAALAAGERLRRTLAGRMITLSSDGRLSVTAAPARRAGALSRKNL
ncbi:MAG: tRNA lysidine(34) synthetase TilS, partial [Beijerinckiaceae bacterium]